MSAFTGLITDSEIHAEHPVLRTTSGSPVPLEQIHIEGQIDSIGSDIYLKQTYFNSEDTYIEAVYTFPLPVDAVFLGMNAEIGDRILTGHARQARKAAEEYEDAIDEGNTAVLLEKSSDGLCTANLGNIAPHERVTLDLHFSLLHRFDGDQLRLCLPTVIGQRYGDPDAAGLLPTAQPFTDFSASYPCTVRLLIRDDLAHVPMSSPTHTYTQEQVAGGTVLLVQDARADRDLVLVFQCAPKELTLAEGGGPEGTVVCAALTLPPEETRTETPRDIQILVDCSGSMGGTSIEQTRVALTHILKRLRPSDAFNIIRFGSGHSALFPRGSRKVSENSIRAAEDFVRNISADMGGTELFSALQTAYRLAEGSERIILLITDGDVYATESDYRDARRSGCIIFPVGVGFAPSEEILTRLAADTNGRHTRCTPGEDMARTITRHFERIGTSRCTVTVTWPGTPLWSSPASPQHVFSGDTEYFFACYDRPEEGTVRFVSSAGRSWSVRMPVTAAPENDDPEDVPRKDAQTDAIAAMGCTRHLPDIATDLRGPLAERYGLLTPWTSYVLTMERSTDDRNPALPEIRQVPQMHADGWGGIGLAGVMCSAVPAAGFFSPGGIRSFLSGHGFFGNLGSVSSACDDVTALTDDGAVMDDPVITDDAAVQGRSDLPAFIDGILGLRNYTVRALLKTDGLPERLARTVERLSQKYGNDALIIGLLLEHIISVYDLYDTRKDVLETAQRLVAGSGSPEDLKDLIRSRIASALEQYV